MEGVGAAFLYDAAVATLAGAFDGQNPVLIVGGAQLRPFCYAPGQIAIFALPGADVVFVRGTITPAQVGSHRPGYINAILIQSRGQPVNLSYSQVRISCCIQDCP